MHGVAHLVRVRVRVRVRAGVRVRVRVRAGIGVRVEPRVRVRRAARPAVDGARQLAVAAQHDRSHLRIPGEALHLVGALRLGLG